MPEASISLRKCTFGYCVQSMSAEDPGLRVIVSPRNQGKGAVVLRGLDRAAEAGFSHVLTMDSDGQHSPERIPAFMVESISQPAAMILGVSVFDASAPGLRVKGRRVSNWWANLETLGPASATRCSGFVYIQLNHCSG